MDNQALKTKNREASALGEAVRSVDDVRRKAATPRLNSYTIHTPRSRQFSICCHADDRSVQPSIAKGNYEPHVQWLLETYCVGRRNILDIGSNYGQHTVLMSALNPTAEVIAIEASPENIEVLERNLAVNGSNNVRVINAFLAERDGMPVDYYYETANAGCAFGCETNYGHLNHAAIRRRVQSSALSSLVSKPVDFIKMDIEGAELATIEGGQEIFESCDHLLIELNKFTSESFFSRPIDDLIDKIQALGFESGILYASQKFHRLTILEIKKIMRTNVLCEILFTK